MTHHGTFVWYELVTSDVAAAQAFYCDVVGWTAADSGHKDMTYMLFSAGERQVAGFMEMPPSMRAGGGRPGWMGFVAVDDVDVATAKAKSLGGGVHREPTDIPGIGRFSVIADPQGAVLMLFRGQGEAPPPAAGGTPGQVGWHELMAAEWESAFAFYHALFGWTKTEAIEMGPMGTYQTFAAGGPAIGGMMTKPPQAPAGWRYYVNVEGIDAAVGRIEAAGGTLVHEPMQVPGGSWIVQGADPEGVGFALVSMTK